MPHKRRVQPLEGRIGDCSGYIGIKRRKRTETTRNTKKRKNGKFGLTLAVLVLLPLFLLRLAAGQIASAQLAGNQPQTRYTLNDLGTLGASFSGAPTINNEALTGRSTRDDGESAQINFVQGKIAFEFLGQATNFAPTPSAPLGSAHQYGFLTVVRGIDNVFSGSPHNEATALLTFFNEATTTESFTDGPVRMVDRNGTTTIYLNSAPASFANPDSFRSGIPVLTSTLHQQAVNTPGGTFTAVFANTISSTSAFTINGTTFRLGQTGQAFRATVTGQFNATPPPSAHFGGYAVGAGGE